jgi:protein-L-isoaspartate(D-aspartate) O-methyltransferase
MAQFALQRKNMVESQVRPSDVTDRRVIRAMLEVPREIFVPEAQRQIAYMDEDVALSPPVHGQASRALIAPRVLARLIQALELGDGDVVLDIGCGTGYASAVLSKIAAKVVALEADHSLADQARKAFATLAIENVTVITGALSAGYPKASPYDAILVEGTVPDVPPSVLDQLKDAGRLVTVVAETAFGRAMQWRRLGGTFDARTLFDAGAPPLPGFERKKEFVF